MPADGTRIIKTDYRTFKASYNDNNNIHIRSQNIIPDKSRRKCVTKFDIPVAYMQMKVCQLGEYVHPGVDPPSWAYTASLMRAIHHS